MKKLLYSLILLNTTAIMPMISDLEYYSSDESEEVSPMEANKIREITESPYLHVNPTYLLENKKTRDSAIDDLGHNIRFTELFDNKVETYLDGYAEIDTLSTIDPLVHVNPVLDKLLLSNHPKKTEAIKAIILNAPKGSYHCPVDRTEQALRREDDCQTFNLNEQPTITIGDKIVSFLSNPFSKPSSITNEMNKVEIARKIGMFGYLIRKLELPNPATDKIFKFVLPNRLSNRLSQQITSNSAEPSLTNALEELTINDLQTLHSNMAKNCQLTKEAQHRYDESVKKAKSEWIEHLKLARATLDRGAGVYNFHTPTPKRDEFDRVIKPIVADVLPEHKIEAIPNFDY